MSLFASKASDADISVVEGVMGLYDGADPVTSAGSTAELARWLDAPILLVINAHGMARSVAALVKGYSGLEEGTSVHGVIANQCGSEVHREWIRESLRGFGLPPLVGAVPRGAFPELSSRHLGLVTADSRNLRADTLDALATALESHAQVDSIVDIARRAASIEWSSPSESTARTGRQIRLGLASDEAFHFYYQDNLEAMEAQGFVLVPFSPISESAVPERLSAIYIGGGYPEEHAQALSANESMLESVRSFAASGRPIYAECGGLMYLSQGIEGREGEWHDLVGLLPARTKMLPRLKSLGYVDVTLEKDSLFGIGGEQLRGHEFHYSELTADPCQNGDWQNIYRVKRRRGSAFAREGYQRGQILASYCHLHFASRPASVAHFIRKCSTWNI